MRAAAAIVIAASLPVFAAQAQDLGPAAPDVLQVDAEALRQQTLADQLACRDLAKEQAAADTVSLYTSASAPLTALAMTVASGLAHGAVAQGRYEKRINECMATRGYVPKALGPGDDAVYRSAVAAGGGRPDAYSLIIRFVPVAGRRTTMIERDNGGQAVQTYSVGRF